MEIYESSSRQFRKVRIQLEELYLLANIAGPIFIEIDAGPILRMPALPGFSPDYNYLVIPAEGSDEILVLNLASLRLEGAISLKSGSRPWQAKCIPNGKGHCYVTSSGFAGDFNSSPRGRGSVTVFDYLNIEIIDEIQVGAGPNGVTVDRQAVQAYVANIRSDSVSVIDVKTHKVVDEISVGKGPAFVKLTVDGSLLLVTNLCSASLTLIDPRRLRVIEEVQIGDPNLNEPFPEYGPGDTTGVAVSENNIAYVTNYRSSEIVRIDLAGALSGKGISKADVAKLPSPVAHPFFVEVERATGKILVSSGFEKRFVLYDDKTGHQIGVFGLDGSGLQRELGEISLWSTLPAENLVCCLAPLGLEHVRTRLNTNLVSKFL
ncbi:hypothetical protein GOC87_03820 [Sinorhizobium meliloti]|uniref:YncE family protein n=1 Tax=Rhizobium meliloti TaxID=382 RepID=UPI000B499C6C|nr:YncE family protein [Sinorhizobium meliloti]ASQ02368.1 hypothetical protein CDO24_26425 [Sinorhizobium meliloti]MDW9702784.1 hypothetical protein [Sinorhizobium meliloti]MDW9932938.1 hypothetical protein [Sinorhizobium meliloti]MDX0098717.1 hypothetical protein [Sinorhizobium meliloti]MDX0117368.1 hypothetical protein [Sinorhizobium meliloti]